MKQFLWSLASVIVAVLIVLGLNHVTNKPLAGAISSPSTNLDFLQLSQGLQIPAGPSVSTSVQGSQIQAMFKGQGVLIMPSYVNLASSSTLPADIAVPGVVSGDTVFSNFATSTAVGSGWEVVGASASSTSGYITLRILNNTGAAATIPASLASSTPYFVIR